MTTPNAGNAMPTAGRQADLQRVVDHRFGMFHHFNLGTFTDEEWTAGGQDPAVFAPTDVDCGQWADAARAAGMSYGVLTTKHHDGFCLWPSAHSEQTVARSGWPHDIVRSFVDAYRSRGLAVGLYFSIWDRTLPVQRTSLTVPDPDQEVEPDGVEAVLAQARELLTGYGPLELFVTDGFAWQMGHRAFPYARMQALVRELQPGCVMVDHAGLVQPWVGDAIYFEEPIGVTAPAGNTYAGLQGQTLNPTWFWRTDSPASPLMARDDILGHLAELEPRWTSFLLNTGPNRDGRLDDDVVEQLREVGRRWRPDPDRPPLPPQPAAVDHQVTVVAALASSCAPGRLPRDGVDSYFQPHDVRLWEADPQDASPTLTLDLGGTWRGVDALRYLPWQFGRAAPTGDVTGYQVETSTDGSTWTEVARGRWASDPEPRLATWPARDAALLRLRVESTDGAPARVNALQVGGRDAPPTRLSLSRADGENLRLVSGATRVDGTVELGADGSLALVDHEGRRLGDTAGTRQEDDLVAFAAGPDAARRRWTATPLGEGRLALTHLMSGFALTATTDGLRLRRPDPADPAQQWQVLPAQDQ